MKRWNIMKFCLYQMVEFKNRHVRGIHSNLFVSDKKFDKIKNGVSIIKHFIT